jgi:hypothetical protein
VKRDATLLMQALPPLTHDLSRSLGSDWSSELISGSEVRVTWGSLVDARRPIETEFDPEDALPPGALDSESRDQALAEDAVEAVATAIQDAVFQAAGTWPQCAEHGGRRLTVCSATWVCPTGHDVAAVGQLPASRSGRGPLRP